MISQGGHDAVANLTTPHSPVGAVPTLYHADETDSADSVGIAREDM